LVVQPHAARENRAQSVTVWEAVTGALGVSLAHFSHPARAAGSLAHFGTRVSRQPVRHGVTFKDGRLAERRRWSRRSRVAWSCCRQGVDQTQRPTRCRRFPRGATREHKTHHELDRALTFPHPHVTCALSFACAHTLSYPLCWRPISHFAPPANKRTHPRWLCTCC
jgi:hypothetical protein